MNIHHSPNDTDPGWADARPALAKLRAPSSTKAIWQLVNTLLPYGVLWYLMVRSVQLGYSMLWTVALAVIAAGFVVRIFILFHDCVHGSFFPSRRANRFFGYVLGVLVFTPFDDWRFTHLRHHGTYANLDTRGTGDIWTLTVEEYRQASLGKRMLYRLYRHPLVLVGLGGAFTFLIWNRKTTPGGTYKERRSVWLTNFFIAVITILAAWLIGWQTFLLIQLPVMWLAGMGGVWLFFVQHQFEGGYWARTARWDTLRAAMEGSSFYKLPAVLNWFSASIGYHHIHHLNPRIPNYGLQASYNAVPEVQLEKPLTLKQSLCCFRFKLWDEAQQKMVPWP